MKYILCIIIVASPDSLNYLAYFWHRSEYDFTFRVSRGLLIFQNEDRTLKTNFRRCVFKWVTNCVRREFRGAEICSNGEYTLKYKSYRLSSVHLNGFSQTRLRFRSPLHLLHDPLNMIPRDAVEKHGCWTQCANVFFRLAPHNFHIQLSGSLKHPNGSTPTNSHKCNQYFKNKAGGIWWTAQEQAGEPVHFFNVLLGRRKKSIVRTI